MIPLDLEYLSLCLTCISLSTHFFFFFAAAAEENCKLLCVYLMHLQRAMAWRAGRQRRNGDGVTDTDGGEMSML